MSNDSQRTVTATVTTALSGSPLAGLMIQSDGATLSVPADWTKEAETNIALAARVSVTVRNPSRPLVTGLAVQGVVA